MSEDFANSLSKGSLDVDPSKGIGRALFRALSQLAQSSGHQELASAKLILLGFSGAGSLVARLAGYAPDRVIAAIPADASQFSPLGIETVTLSPEARQAVRTSSYLDAVGHEALDHPAHSVMPNHRHALTSCASATHRPSDEVSQCHKTCSGL
jgi:hypothetical protein